MDSKHADLELINFCYGSQLWDELMYPVCSQYVCSFFFSLLLNILSAALNYNAGASGGSINRKLDCSARFGPSSDQSSLPSIARSLPSDNKNKHNQMAAILKRTCDRQDTLFLTSGVNYSV